jgi:hypothetical protein
MGFMKDVICVPLVPNSIEVLKIFITQAIQQVDEGMLAEFGQNWTIIESSAML